MAVTLQTYIDRAMRLNSVDVSQYTPANALEDAIIIYHQIEDYITSDIWEWFFLDIAINDTTVISQSEYTLPIISSGNFNWIPKIESISVKYTEDWEYIPAREVERTVLLQTHDLSWYEVNQSNGDPIYFIADNSYFIYPAPKEAATNWIKLYGIKSLSDIVATTAEADLFWGKIPTKYHNLISEGMEQFIFATQGKKAEAENAKNIFELEKLPKLVKKLGDRKVGIQLRWTPDISIYK